MSNKRMNEFFDLHFEHLKNMIFDITIFTSEPVSSVCTTIGEGLQILASEGNRNAAVIYAAIASYDGEINGFEKDIAIKLLLDIDDFREYCKFIEDEFEGVVEECRFFYMYSFPVVYLLKQIVDGRLCG